MNEDHPIWQALSRRRAAGSGEQGAEVMDTKEARDPRVDPTPGDTLDTATGRIRFWNYVTSIDGRIEYGIQYLHEDSAGWHSRRATLADWRRWATDATVVREGW